MSTTLLTDNLTGSAASNLTAHTADSGNTWTKIGPTTQGNLLLDGSGGVYQSTASSFGWYLASGTFANNNTCTITANIKCFSNLWNMGIGFFDSSNNNYFLNLDHTVGFVIKRAVGSTGTSTTLKSVSMTPTAGHIYAVVFSCSTNGTTVTLSGYVYDTTAATMIWMQTNFTDTTYPTVNQVGIISNDGASPDTGSTGNHAMALSAIYETLSTVATNDAGFYYSPYNWFKSGSTYALSNCAGAYLKFGFTLATPGAIALNFDTSLLGANPLIIRSSVDGLAFTDTDIQGLSTLSLAVGLAAGAHQAWVIYRGRTIGIDSWTLTGSPCDSLKITSVTLPTSATTAAPTVFANQMFVLSDSKGEGYDSIGSAGIATSQDATIAVPFSLMEAFACETGVRAFGGLGWTTTGLTNVPALPSSWNLYYAGNSLLSSGLLSPAPAYIVVLDMGGNDSVAGASDAAVAAAVASTLAALRTAAPAATIVVVPSYDTRKASATQTGIATYQAATPDSHCFYADPALTAAEITAIRSSPNATYLSLEGAHPNAFGNAIMSARVVQAMQTAIAPTVPVITKTVNNYFYNEPEP